MVKKINKTYIKIHKQNTVFSLVLDICTIVVPCGDVTRPPTSPLSSYVCLPVWKCLGSGLEHIQWMEMFVRRWIPWWLGRTTELWNAARLSSRLWLQCILWSASSGCTANIRRVRPAAAYCVSNAWSVCPGVCCRCCSRSCTSSSKHRFVYSSLIGRSW